jgi:hypothetical protein
VSPLQPSTLQPRGTNLAALRSRRGAASLLETVVAHRSRRGGASLLGTVVPHLSLLAAAKLHAVAHRSLLQLGASWLCPYSLLSPRRWRASKLRPCELVLLLQRLQPIEVEGQVVIPGPGHSDLVVRQSADAEVVSWKK